MGDPRRNRVRWLLRALVEPPFLRLYLEETPRRPTLRAFEDAFFSLAPDGERPEADRMEAWTQIERWMEPTPPTTPADWFRANLLGLRKDFVGEASELGRFWALGELFDGGPSRSIPLPSDAPPYHEIHCHLRSGVPFLAMWRGYVESDRKRVALRPLKIEVGTWKKTWAELVAKAAEASRDAGAAHDAEYVRCLIARVVSATTPHENDVKYLATCAGLSAVLTCHRGEPGLSPFDRSYDRYSKAQKVRGSPGRQHTRTLVASALRRFEEDRVAAVELRPTLDRKRGEVQQKLQDVVLGYFEYLAGVESSRVPVALGVVTSLVKQEALGGREPSDPAFWEAQEAIWADEIRTLLATLDDVPALRWFVVGVDAAGKERGCSLRSLRSAYALVRDHNRGRSLARPGRRMSVDFLRNLVGPPGDSIEARVDCAWQVLNQRPVLPIRLGLTVHAGEDFEDPMTGLRNIWEAAVDLDLGDGDRIGHALAAGLDKERVKRLLTRRTGIPNGEVRSLGSKGFTVSKPRGTHLLDLAWICRAGGPEEAHAAELRLGEVAARAFGAPMGATHLARELGRAGALARAALPGARYFDPAGVGTHDRETVVVDDRWLDLTERMRRRVLHELVCRGIVVESCPTSNLVVPNLDGEPPLLGFTNTSVRVAVATDNPGLLSCYPGAEMRHIQDEELRRKVLQTAARASFVWRTEDK